jgi:hypothetical protein
VQPPEVDVTVQRQIREIQIWWPPQFKPVGSEDTLQVESWRMHPFQRQAPALESRDRETAPGRVRGIDGPTRRSILAQSLGAVIGAGFAQRAWAAAATYSTAAELAGASPTADAVQLRGWNTPDDGGALRLKRAGEGSPLLVSQNGVEWFLDGNKASTLCFGAVGDGATDNFEALQRAFSWLRRGRTLVVAPGITCTSGYHAMPDGAVLCGHDKSSGICSIRKLAPGDPAQLGSPIWFGHWHPIHNGVRPIGAIQPYQRRIELHACRHAARKRSRSVMLTDPSAAKLFEIGQIYYVRSQAAYSQTTTGLDIEVPVENTLVRIVRIDRQGGVVHLENELGFDDPRPPLLCRIKPGATEGAGRVHFVQDCVVRDLRIDGRTLFGSVSPGAYRCKMLNCTGDCVSLIMANGLAYCEIRGINASFVERVGEFKFCSHDSRIMEVVARSNSASPPQASAIGLWSVGEGARNLTIASFDIQAPLWSAGHLFQIQACKQIFFKDGRIAAPASTDQAILFYTDDYSGVEGVNLTNITIIHSARTTIRFQGNGSKTPVNNTVDHLYSFTHSKALPNYAVRFEGGERNTVSSSQFNEGGVFGVSAASQNSLVGVRIGPS